MGDAATQHKSATARKMPGKCGFTPHGHGPWASHGSGVTPLKCRNEESTREPLPDIIGNANEMRAPEIEMANVDSAYIAPAPEIQS